MDHILRVSESGKLLPSWIELGSFCKHILKQDCLRGWPSNGEDERYTGEFVRKHADFHNIKQTGAMEGMLLCEENSGSSRDPLLITPSLTSMDLML